MGAYRRRRAARAAVPLPRPPARRPGTLLALGLALTTVLGAAVAGARAVLTGGGCRQSATVRLAVTPELEPVVRGAVRRLGFEPDGHGRCVDVDVSIRSGAALAAEIGRGGGSGLGLDLPDAWLPDSSLWLAQARRQPVGVRRIRSVSGPVAVSPLVFAVARPAATAAGWPRRQPDWRRVRTAPGTGPALADPEQSSAGLATLLSFGQRPGPLGTPDLTGVSTFARGVVVPRLGDDPSPADALGSQGVGAIPTAEFDVLLHNQATADPRSRLAALYDPRVHAALDYPFVRLAADRHVAPDWAVSSVEVALRGPRAREALGRQGLRAPDGAPPPAASDPLDRAATGALPVRVPRWTPPPDATVRAALASWSRLGRRARALLVVDVSGSMSQPMPGSGTTRMAVVRQALASAVRASTPDAELGLWTFAGGRSGSPAYRQLVPTGPLYAGIGGVTRQVVLLRAIDRLAPDPSGNTALYATTLAAFRTAGAGYDYGRLNSVIVLTDGANEDPGGPALGNLLGRLRLEFDGVRPVRVITLAYGPAADTASLTRISDVTGGRAYGSVGAGGVPAMFRQVLDEL